MVADLPIDVQMALDDMSPDQRLHFEEMVARGENPRLAVMCSVGKSPAGKSDESFVRERGANGAQWADQPEFADEIVRRTKNKNPGWSPKGKIHVSQLARGFDDAKAWVSDMSEAKKVAEERNMQGNIGGVEIVPREIEHDRTYRVDPKIVDRAARKMMKQNPKLKLAAAREAARDKITPKGLKKGVDKVSVLGDDD